MLTKCHLPPTSAIVQNLAEEIISREVGKNWTSQFIRWHKDKLESLYLRNIDNMHTKAEYGPVFKQYFNLVSVFYCALYILSCHGTNLHAMGLPRD